MAGSEETVARPLPFSPLARGVGYRLCWAGGLSVLLWLGVLWASA